MGSTVEAVCWDISLGIAKTDFGKWLLEATSSQPECSPEAIDHVGIKVFDTLYEYGDEGILMSPVLDGESKKLKSKYPAYALRSVEVVGTTPISQEEFEEWVAEQNQQQFTGKNYNVVKNSCIVWGIAACKFLEVPYPPNWNKMIAYAKNNKKVAGLLGRSGMGSRAVFK